MVPNRGRAAPLHNYGGKSDKEGKKLKVKSERCMDNGRSLSTYLKLTECKKIKTSPAGKLTKD